MKKLISILIVLLFLSACDNGQSGHAGHHNSGSSEKLAPLKVSLTVPEKAQAGDKVDLKAKVTYGKDNVNDADEVMFEIIKDNKAKSSVKEKVAQAKAGVYTLKYSFDKPGTYTIISHVTAKNQHTMPDADIVISK
ncbi:FixH family protein [Macrococcus lamae]|uniref:YtkA-like domain-containing protein n=1 Tax=Macrococcus lamae TaxID=198484 RepID=A0A4R6BW45_9STAP|nr:FixH family protein [Macrococcus lamae]TDM12624.1 hypothetical protein ERX29_03165 [Macrococcus lamae]